jgi:PqqD family protein of HPr-rel-A system
MDPEIRWRPLRPQALAWREWDDEFVVFNDDTGSTHHLNALGGEVMLALLRHPDGIGVTGLVRDLEQRFETSADIELAAEIEHTLSQLATLEIAASSAA